MCNVCVTHGYGKTWYKHAENYARQMYKLRKPGQVPKEAGADPESQASLIIEEAIEAKAVAPERFDEMRKTALKLVTQYSVGQAVPIQEAEKVVDLASPIALMGCICRRQVRGRLEDNEKSYSCLGLGVGMFKWDRWPERYKGSVEFVTPEEAKKWLRKWNKMGMMHILMTFGTPYLGGVCNCDYPDCLAIRWRLDYGITSSCVKAEYVAKVDYDACSGCTECVARCQFGALKMEVTTRKANIDLLRCFGCGLCETGCAYGAINLVERQSIPVLRNVW